MQYKILLSSLLLMTSYVSFAEVVTSQDLNTEAQSGLQEKQVEPQKDKPVASEKETVSEEKARIYTGRRVESAEETAAKTEAANLSEELANKVKQKVLSEVTADAEKNNDKKKTEEKTDPVVDALSKEQKLLLLENMVKEERLKKENEALLTKLQKLKWEKEVLTTSLDIDLLNQEVEHQASVKAHSDKLLKLTQEVEIAEEKSRRLTAELETQRIESDLKTAKLEAEIKTFSIEQERKKYADKSPVYLDNPVVNGDTLVVSDRRISMNGPITRDTADYVSTRINYFNNKGEKPIFLVIDSSPGGSAMAGYRIIKAMEASKAPVYVVVKSLAASMAAIITTLAERSYAYPNAIIVHHQLSKTFFLARLNVTQQKELYEDSKKWWDRMATPIAKKMGITADEFITKMYEKNSDGDWAEFGTEAKELHWVNNIVQRIEETSLIIDPDEDEASEELAPLREATTAEGKAVVYLPHLSPKDVYFVYDPDHYYRVR